MNKKNKNAMISSCLLKVGILCLPFKHNLASCFLFVLFLINPKSISISQAHAHARTHRHRHTHRHTHIHTPHTYTKILHNSNKHVSTVSNNCVDLFTFEVTLTWRSYRNYHTLCKFCDIKSKKKSFAGVHIFKSSSLMKICEKPRSQ